MAKCTKSTVSRRRVVKQVVDETVSEYTLTLSQEEAKALRVLVGGIAGPDDGPRGEMNRVWDALRDAGVHYDDNIRFTVKHGRPYLSEVE